MPIQPHYRSIRALLQGRSFGIDEYQREYKWEKRNIDELLNDLLGRFQSAYRNGDDAREASTYPEYFLGSIIVTDRVNRSYLVDGQQRVTSLTLMLIHLYREATERGLRVASTIEPLIFSDDYGDLRFNLDIPERTPVLHALFQGEAYEPDGKDASVANLVARYEDIRSVDFEDELRDGFEPFIYWLLNRVGLIEIVAGSDAQAYAIFETMNDRGKPLSPVDMLKAYLLAPIEDADERARANATWRKTVLGLTTWGVEVDAERDAAAVKAWLRARYATSVRERRAGAVDRDWEQLGTTFHRWIRDNEGRVGTGNAARNLEVMTEELPYFARAYLQILDASTSYTPGLEHIFYNAHNEFTWQPTVLLAPLTRFDDPQTTRAKMAATAAFLDGWIMRRVMNYARVGYSSVSYAMWSLVNAIRGLPLPDLVSLLEERLAGDDATFDGYESRGRLGVADLRLNQFSKRYIFHALARMTSYVERESGRPDLFAEYVNRSTSNPFDIEHIWADAPARFSDDFDSEQSFLHARDNLAGLLLLPADVNRSLQDKTFEEKIPHYAKANLLAASLTPIAYENAPQFKAFIGRSGLDFKFHATFGVSEQSERRQLLTELSKQIWSPSAIRSAAGLP